MATQNDNFRIEAGKPIDDRYTRFGLPYVDAAQVNATIVISRRYKGLTVLVGNVEYWYREGITDTDLVIKTTGSGGGAGASASGEFLFSTDVTASDPGDGKLKLNNNFPDLATAIYVDKLTTDGIDIGALLENLATNDGFRIQVAADDDNNIVYKLTAPPIDNTGWWTIPVEFKAISGSLIGDLVPIVAIVIIGGGGVNTVIGEQGVTIDNTDPQNPIAKIGGDVTEFRQILVKTYLGPPTEEAAIILDNGSVVFSAYDNTTFNGIALSAANSRLVVTDDRPTKKGMEYANDYSASFVDRSLVDKKYVDDQVVDFNVDGGTANSIYNTIPIVDGGGP